MFYCHFSKRGVDGHHLLAHSIAFLGYFVKSHKSVCCATNHAICHMNLDNMNILDLSVQEDTGDSTVSFETLSVWNKYASRDEKAGKCGLLEAYAGYEICWGFGKLGHHKYTVTYTVTNIVKSYQGGDAMSFNFLSKAAGGVSSLNIYLNSDHFPDFVSLISNVMNTSPE